MQKFIVFWAAMDYYTVTDDPSMTNVNIGYEFVVAESEVLAVGEVHDYIGLNYDLEVIDIRGILWSEFAANAESFFSEAITAEPKGKGFVAQWCLMRYCNIEDCDIDGMVGFELAMSKNERVAETEVCDYLAEQDDYHDLELVAFDATEWKTLMEQAACALDSAMAEVIHQQHESRRRSFG